MGRNVATNHVNHHPGSVKTASVSLRAGAVTSTTTVVTTQTRMVASMSYARKTLSSKKHKKYKLTRLPLPSLSLIFFYSFF